MAGEEAEHELEDEVIAVQRTLSLTPGWANSTSTLNLVLEE